MEIRPSVPDRSEKKSETRRYANVEPEETQGSNDDVFASDERQRLVSEGPSLRFSENPLYGSTS